MDRFAIFVDAGYVFAQGSDCLTGKKVNRKDLQIDPAQAISTLESFSRSRVSGIPLLRVYWYDGAYNGPSSDQLILAHMSNVKLRLGFINSVGQQKGVDSLIITDLIDLSRNRAICDAVMVTGDEDLRVGVQVAQEFGVRVHLVGIVPSRGSQSKLLLQEADTTHELTKADVSGFLSVKTPLNSTPPPEATPAVGLSGRSPDTEAVLTSVIEEILKGLGPLEAEALNSAIVGSSQVPHEIDRRILGKSRALLGRILTGPESSRARSLLAELVKTRKKI
jgi:uncharacterized LabA/DUF88 family protein